MRTAILGIVIFLAVAGGVFAGIFGYQAWIAYKITSNYQADFEVSDEDIELKGEAAKVIKRKIIERGADKDCAEKAYQKIIADTDLPRRKSEMTDEILDVFMNADCFS